MRSHTYVRATKPSGGGGSTAFWLIAAVMVIGYAYYMPDDPAPPPRRHVMELRQSEQGHFYLDAKGNGMPVRFLVDTGASRIVLPVRLAARLGFPERGLEWSGTASTANGTVKTARITIRELSIAGTVFRNVPASVSQGELDEPLLGMEFLSGLSGYSVADGVMTLRF